MNRDNSLPYLEFTVTAEGTPVVAKLMARGGAAGNYNEDNDLAIVVLLNPFLSRTGNWAHYISIPGPSLGDGMHIPFWVGATIKECIALVQSNWRNCVKGARRREKQAFSVWQTARYYGGVEASRLEIESLVSLLFVQMLHLYERLQMLVNALAMQRPWKTPEILKLRRCGNLNITVRQIEELCWAFNIIRSPKKPEKKSILVVDISSAANSNESDLVTSPYDSDASNSDDYEDVEVLRNGETVQLRLPTILSILRRLRKIIEREAGVRIQCVQRQERRQINRERRPVRQIVEDLDKADVEKMTNLIKDMQPDTLRRLVFQAICQSKGSGRLSPQVSEHLYVLS